MTSTLKMTAPSLTAGLNVTTQSGNSYTSDVNGLINAQFSDVNGLEAAGFLPLSQTAVPTMTISTAAGVYLNQGMFNLIPASTVAAIALLAAPAIIGQTTRLAALSTGNVTITSSGCSLLDEKGNSATVLTCSKGTAELIAVGSTLYQIIVRSISSNSSNAVVYGIASS